MLLLFSQQSTGSFRIRPKKCHTRAMGSPLQSIARRYHLALPPGKGNGNHVMIFWSLGGGPCVDSMESTPGIHFRKTVPEIERIILHMLKARPLPVMSTRYIHICICIYIYIHITPGKPIYKAISRGPTTPQNN